MDVHDRMKKGESFPLVVEASPDKTVCCQTLGTLLMPYSAHVTVKMVLCLKSPQDHELLESGGLSYLLYIPKPSPGSRHIWGREGRWMGGK